MRKPSLYPLTDDMGNDYFQFRQFTVHQGRCAMKVGTDGTLLGAWARGGRRILDIGTGTGLIALMMAQRYSESLVVGVEIDGAAAEQARQNAEASPFAERIEIVHGDIAGCTGEYDAVVCNPPYFGQSLHSPDSRRTLARHDATLTYAALLRHARRLMSDDAELSVVIPADSIGRMESEAALAGMFKSRECKVCTTATKAPKRCLMAFTLHPATLERTMLTLGSEQYRQLVADFYIR